MIKARISAIEYHLPERVLTNEQLVADFGDWDVEKIVSKVGIETRHIAEDDECASDLGVLAVKKLFASGVVSSGEIDCLLLCTQSPDYFLPTTACIMQDRLGLPKSCLALDFNLGCSGFVYGLGLAKGLIETNQARNVLLITADTYTKFIAEKDRSVRTLFGDGAAATLITGNDSQDDLIGPFVYGTDGSGADNLIVPSGGMRRPRDEETSRSVKDSQGNLRSLDNLYMNGTEILNFSLRRVPEAVNQLYGVAGIGPDLVDMYVFHQANQFMLEMLRKKCQIPREKFLIACRDVGNTVSSTIPIALKMAELDGLLTKDMRIMLVGFGVGYSWGGTIIRW